MRPSLKSTYKVDWKLLEYEVRSCCFLFPYLHELTFFNLAQDPQIVCLRRLELEAAGEFRTQAVVRLNTKQVSAN
jgi:hypothetical protein